MPNEDATARAEPALAGRFRLQATLYEHGLLRLQQAYDEEDDRTVALIRPREGSSEIAEPLEEALRRLIEVRTPHLLSFCALGWDENGLSFGVADFEPLPTLAETLEEAKSLSVRVALQLGLQLCDALRGGHQASVIHGHLDPGLIFLESDELELQLAGFCFPGRLEGDQVRVPPGPPRGLPYGAPEQWRGEPMDQRSDVYSVGLLLHQMLTGELPTEHEGLWQSILAGQTQGPAPVSQLREVPGPVDRVLRKALQTRPSERFQTVSELRGALDTALEALAEPAPEPPAQQPEAPPPPPPAPANVVVVEERQDSRFWRLFAVIIALLAVGVAALILMETGQAADTVEVPNLEGLPLEDAAREATARDLNLRVSEFAPDQTAPAGTVVRQAPAAGARAERESEVEVIVSHGAEPLASDAAVVPYVLGLQLEQARDRLQAAGLLVGTVTQAPNQTYPAGTVTAQMPAAGTPVAEGSEVDLTVSSGP